MHWEAVSPFPLSIRYATVVWDLRLETVPIVQWDKARAHGSSRVVSEALEFIWDQRGR